VLVVAEVGVRQRLALAVVMTGASGSGTAAAAAAAATSLATLSGTSIRASRYTCASRLRYAASVASASPISPRNASSNPA